jgi:hypothetical protein
MRRMTFAASGGMRSGVQNSVSPFWMLTLRSVAAQDQVGQGAATQVGGLAQDGVECVPVIGGTLSY